MQYSAALLALLPVAIASTIRVDVGKGGLIFSPQSVQALPGDNIEFHYNPKNHSVTQSNFSNPCVPLPNGINSGFVPVANDSATASTRRFIVQVNDTKPIWIYCAQGKHCASGMSMVINEPKTKNTLAAYQLVARNATTVINPVAPVGGTFISSDLPANVTRSSLPLTTYTTPYSTYATSASGTSTTVTLAQTVTALSFQSGISSASGTITAAATITTTGATGAATSGAAATTSIRNAAPTLGAAGWAVAAGAAVFGGLII